MQNKSKLYFHYSEFKTGNTRLTPVKGRDNVYTIETGADTNDKFIATLYFVDGDIFVFGEVVCRENGNHYRNAVVGVRNLRIAYARSAQIQEILNDLQYETRFEPDETEISHTRRCSYPPPRRNPYTTKPIPHHGGGGYSYYRH
uniref:Uncharacterized protein n=1 Tax=Strigamia maritima TaxID=126957 RepID=T1J9T7_STRMM